MKILHLLDIPWWSGLSAYALECAQAQQACGYQVTLACDKNSLPFKKAQTLGIPLLPMHGRKFLDSVLNFRLLDLHLQKNKPDWIICHNGSTHTLAWLLGKKYSIPVIRTRATAQKIKKSFLNSKLFFAFS